MKNFWRKYKEILCKSIAFAAFYIVLVGFGMAVFDGTQASGAGNETPTISTPTRSGNYILAAKSTDGKFTVSIDWEKQDMKLESTDKDEYFYISDARQKTWDEVDASNGIAYTDLSWITKEYELNIRRDKDLTNILKIKVEAPRTLKAKFAIVNEKPTINMTVTTTVDKKKTTADLPETEKNKVEWRKGTAGSWQPYNTLNMEDFMTKGATLNLRLKGECNTNSNCHMPSKIGSVKIAKKTNAPSVKVDTSKFTLGVKKGQEYIVSVQQDTTTGTAPITTPVISVKDNSAAKPELSQLGNTGSTDGTNTGNNPSTGNPSTGGNTTTNILGGDGYEKPFNAFTVKVRTAATEKKATSKWTIVSYPKQRTISKEALVVKMEAGKGATLQNTTAYDIEYVIAETDLIQSVSMAKFNEKTRWSKVKAGKTAKARESTITANTAVFIRYAAEKEDAKKGQKAELASAVGITRADQAAQPTQST